MPLNDAIKTETMAGVKSGGAGAAADAALLLVYAAGGAVVPPVFPLGDNTVLGREPPPSSGSFVLEAPSVSRLHARIARRDDAWIIVDLGSRNGVLVNGRLVREAALAEGDIVRVGDALFRFVSTGASEHASGPARIPHREAATIPGAVGGHALAKIAAELAVVAPTNLSVLVQGETGSGKELVARAVHTASGRQGPFCALNCAAMPANLIESELFGHMRGAYTGADRERVGYVRRAHQGTLMLDEIGDMPLEAQAKLLRVLETREVIPVGAERPIAVDVRIVCATHRDLHALVKEGQFRGDLLARIHGCTVRLLPLRERKEDLFPLLRHFWSETAPGEPDFTFAFMAALAHYDWPYNVRELQAVIRRAIAMAQGARLDVVHLPDAVRDSLRDYGSRAGATSAASSAPAAPPVSTVPLSRPGPLNPSRDQLLELLGRHRGNLAAIGRELGKDRAQVHRWMRQHDIDPEAFRGL